MIGKRLTIEEFLEKARKTHKDKYNYSKVEYINNRTKICIICNIHGEFWQIPDNHWRLKCGCPKCAGNMKLTTKEFIRRSIKIHDNKYDYSKVKYERNDVKVEIICKDHGTFLQTPHHHMDGSKCPKCVNNQQMTKDDFVEKAIKAHGNKYDYSKIKYNHIKNKEIIICKKHGEFKQKLDNHLQGKGCPHCINKNEGIVKDLLLKYFKGWKRSYRR